MKKIMFLAASLASLTLVSCSGSSGDSGGSTSTAPVVNAGADQSVSEGAQVSLSATASDPNGDSLTYTWSQSSGTAVTLSATNTLATSFTAPDVTQSEDLVFSLAVSDGTTTTTDTVTIGVTDPSAVILNVSLLSSDFTSTRTVSCTLDDGTSTTCYELTVPYNSVGAATATGGVGPYCPETTSTPRNQAGFGIWDGNTNPGFQSLLDAATNMEADGYDAISSTGVIYERNPSQGADNSGVPDTASACLAASFSTGTFTYQVPQFPVARSSAYQIGEIGDVGLGLNGVVFKGAPPSAENGPAGMALQAGIAGIPSLDHCGGHPDPRGWYHWHFIPQSINTILSDRGFTANDGISCQNSKIEFDKPSSLAGYAMDGYPIYGSTDDQSGTDVAPSTVGAVDECNGHTHVTDAYPDGVYHYHALDLTAPNMLSCIKGKFSNSFFSN